VRKLRHVARGILMLALLALVVPGAAVRPTTVSLSRVETAKSVDFEDGVVWVLVLGRDDEDHTDTIELLAFDGETGAASAIGIPRDSWVRLPDGKARINEAWSQGGGEQGGADLAARTVGELVGVDPDFVLVTGFEGFLAMSEEVGEVEVRSPQAFKTDQGLAVRRGPNRFDAEQALDFARSRDNLQDDFDRMANNQALLLGYLRSLRAHEDERGFMEDVTLAALGGLETDLAPTDLYRLAQAVTQVDPNRVTGCLVTGTPFTSGGGAEVIRADRPLAQRLGDDARNDATLEPGCQG
jgi:polyisoprenyl-teichoic acid--peptidoglycan teichoic acid transferase